MRLDPNHLHDVAEAADYIGDFLVRWGRVHVVQTKEKYGTARVYLSFGWSSLLNITHPRYQHYGPYPEWLRELDMGVLYRIVSPLNYVVVPFHKWLYRLVYRRAIARWPHIRYDILDGADYIELLKDLYQGPATTNEERKT